MQGDKLKNPLLKDDSFDQPQDNILFKEEKKNMSFKNIIKRMEKRKISPEKPKSVRSQLKSKIISKVSAKELNNKKFSYKINVNCKVLKYNLVAEKANNKFFSIRMNLINSMLDGKPCIDTYNLIYPGTYAEYFDPIAQE